MPRVIPLSELDATFVRVRMEPAPAYIGRPREDGTTQWGGFPSAVIHKVPHLLGAHGVRFGCPDDKSDGHFHQIFFEGVEVGDLNKSAHGVPVAWVPAGTCIDDLSLVPSISTSGAACRWHGWVRKGVLEID